LLCLHGEGRLRGQYADLASVLRDHADTYSLLRFLDQRFNGDLFPGKEVPTGQCDQVWVVEMAEVQQAHLVLWPLYAFDVIPLGFVSNIYEAFVHKRSKSTVYTPVHLVDFLLDGVLPWDGEEWNLRILDPACGSGVFLVRAFQRLIHRWRQAHPDREPDGVVLASLLENNLGVDIDPAAVRVASFNLYLGPMRRAGPRSIGKRCAFPAYRIAA